MTELLTTLVSVHELPRVLACGCRGCTKWRATSTTAIWLIGRLATLWQFVCGSRNSARGRLILPAS